VSRAIRLSPLSRLAHTASTLDTDLLLRPLVAPLQVDDRRAPEHEHGNIAAMAR
jgi:hypothetical protein